jgi:hypothetical protein
LTCTTRSCIRLVHSRLTSMCKVLFDFCLLHVSHKAAEIIAVQSSTQCCLSSFQVAEIAAVATGSTMHSAAPGRAPGPLDICKVMP